MSLFDWFIIILAILLIVFGLFMLGFAVRPRSYRPHTPPGQPGPLVEFRPDLPEPVRRHFAATIGSPAPRIESAVVWGWGRACINGIWFPLRFKAWYRPGADFSRRMQVTWYQRPFLSGQDLYRRGQGLYRLANHRETGAQINQNQNLSMWADTVWMPSVFVHSPAIQWLPGETDQTGAQTAILRVPFETGADELRAHFDANTGLMTHLTAMRYNSGSHEKEPWRVDLLEWKRFGGLLIPSRVAMAWGEPGSPVSYWNVEGVAYNVDVSDQLSD